MVVVAPKPGEIITPLADRKRMEPSSEHSSTLNYALPDLQRRPSIILFLVAMVVMFSAIVFWFACLLIALGAGSLATGFRLAAVILGVSSIGWLGYCVFSPNMVSAAVDRTAIRWGMATALIIAGISFSIGLLLPD